jgi:hypothetical protein
MTKSTYRPKAWFLRRMCCRKRLKNLSSVIRRICSRQERIRLYFLSCVCVCVCARARVSAREYLYKLNFVAVVRKRTIPTERPPLVGGVSVKLCGQRVLGGQGNEFPRLSTWFTRPGPLLFYSCSSSVVLTRLSRPCSRPITSQKIWQDRELNPGLLDL